MVGCDGAFARDLSDHGQLVGFEVVRIQPNLVFLEVLHKLLVLFETVEWTIQVNPKGYMNFVFSFTTSLVLGDGKKLME